MAGLAVALWLSALVASDGASAASSPPHKLPTHQAAKRAVIRCGVPSKNVSIQYERSMDEDLVWIAGEERHLSNSALDCLAAASLKTSYYVYFRDRQEQKAYDPRYWRLSRQAEVTDARKWLSARKFLSTVPRPVKGRPLANYAEAVEAFCGIKKQTLLVARDEHIMTFAVGGLGEMTAPGMENSAATNAQFECVMEATAAVDLNAYGIFFGFIRNANKAP